MHNIIDIEKKLKEQYEKDKSDPSVYSLIKELTEGILVTKKLLDNSTDIDGVAHEVAVDLYYKVNNDSKPFIMYAWTKYIMKCLRGYINGYHYYNRDKQILWLEDPTEQYEYKKRNYPSLYPVDDQDLRDTISELPEFVTSFYNKYTRYYKDSELYKDTLVSLYLSVYYNKLYIYGNTDYNLLSLLYKLLIKNISSLILNNIPNNTITYDNIKLFELDVDGGDEFD